MKKSIAVFLACALAFAALPLFAAAKSGNLSENIAAETRALAVEIESEGVVLLKNTDGALPLKNKPVNVFARARHGAARVRKTAVQSKNAYKGVSAPRTHLRRFVHRLA